MYERVTVTMDVKNISKIRILQAKKIKETKKSCSFSKMLNLVVTDGLKFGSAKKQKTTESRLKTE